MMNARAPSGRSRDTMASPPSTLTTIGESPIDVQLLYAGATMAS